MPAFCDLVLIGRLVRPQGRQGEIVAEPLSDRPERFPTLRRAFVPGPGGAPLEVRVLRCWPHKGRFVLQLEGVSSIEAAERYRGLELRIGEEDLPPLADGSYYHHQLEGLRVESTEGRAVGVVEGLLETGAGAKVLVVRGPAGESLLPLTDEVVRAVDLDAGRIVVAPPEYVRAD